MFTSSVANKFELIFSEFNKSITDLKKKEKELLEEVRQHGGDNLGAKKYVMIRDLNSEIRKLSKSFDEKKFENVSALKKETIITALQLSQLIGKYFENAEHAAILNTPRRKMAYHLSLFAHAGLTTSIFFTYGATVPACLFGAFVISSALFNLKIKTHTMAILYIMYVDLKAMQKFLSDGFDCSEINESYYDMLGVPLEASTKEIAAAYKSKSLIYHPDKRVGGPTDESTAHYQKIVEAYKTLSDPQTRKAYDYWHNHLYHLKQDLIHHFPPEHKVETAQAARTDLGMPSTLVEPIAYRPGAS